MNPDISRQSPDLPQESPGQSNGLLMLTPERPYSDLTMNMGFPKIRGTLLGGPHDKDCIIWGTILGSPYIGKLPHVQAGRE